MLLDSLYKTNYSTTDNGHMEIQGGHFPLRYYKTQWTKNDPVLAAFTEKLQPSGVLNLIGGFTAAILIFAEMNGIAAAEFVLVVDSHYVTSDTLQAYAPVVH